MFDPVLYRLPVAVFSAEDDACVTVHICVPSAHLMYSPFALLPRSMIAPVGTPLDWETVPRMLVFEYAAFAVVVAVARPSRNNAINAEIVRR